MNFLLFKNLEFSKFKQADLNYQPKLDLNQIGKTRQEIMMHLGIYDLITQF
jgi:hypothetical protein